MHRWGAHRRQVRRRAGPHRPPAGWSGRTDRGGAEAGELDRRGGRRRDVHRFLCGGGRGRRDPGRETALDPRQSGAGGDRGAGRALRRRGAARRRAAAGPRHHGRDQRHHPASRRAGDPAHHRRIPRPSGDRPADPAAHVRPLPRPAPSPRAARAPDRGRRTGDGRGAGGAGAWAAGDPRGDGRARRGRGGCVRGVPALLVPAPGPRGAPRRRGAGGAAGPSGLALLGGPARIPGVRTVFHDGAERMAATGHGRVHGEPGGGAPRPDPGRPHRNQPVERWPHVAGEGARHPGPYRSLWPRRRGGRGDRRGCARRASRPHHPRHGGARAPMCLSSAT